ncbi:MAG: FGGY family carbohydrate kinase [Anaerolineae bacterium]|nr:FGGY family carbohydrate kinase [Anaerolineae bacterium]
MSLLGIDVGTTGCKAAVFSEEGSLLASAYEEYDILRPQPGWAELDARDVWDKVRATVRQVSAASSSDPIQALAVSSLGEAMVPVTASRKIAGTSIVANFDLRGDQYLDPLRTGLDEEALYRITGNTLGGNYSLPKLLWIKQHQPDLYQCTDKFLLWGGFVSYMLGSSPAVDFSLANRSLLFDVDREDWSQEILELAGLDSTKLPETVPSGTAIGTVSRHMAAELGLPPGTAIVAGAHDQCATAVGCGVVEDGQAVYGMGTFTCITPVFSQRRAPSLMLERGLNTEHHAVPGKYVSFIYNPGGSLVKWFRDTLAAGAHAGHDVYGALLAEMPPDPSGIMVLPHFAPTGPPGFVSDSTGLLAGLRLETSRGEILKGILEGISFYLRECVDALPPTGIEIAGFRVAGGGSRSDRWVQLCADIFGQRFVRPSVAQAGTLGAAIIAAVGSGLYPTFAAAVEAMVRLDRAFEPDPHQHRLYAGWYELYKELWPTTAGYLRALASKQASRALHG